jgi:hypothetical protein
MKWFSIQQLRLFQAGTHFDKIFIRAETATGDLCGIVLFNCRALFY